MKKILTFVVAIIIALSSTGCQEVIPVGTVGKVMNKSGWEPEIIPPGTVHVDTTFTMVPEKLFLVQTTTRKFVEPIKVLLKDKLTLKADIVFRGRINSNTNILNAVFNDIQMDDQTVTTNEVYNVYGKMVILNTARSVISKYNVDEVNRNYARITAELYNALKPKLRGLPIEISDVTIGNIEYPTVVTEAIEAAKKRRMEIEKEEAQVQIELTKAKGREELAKAEYKIKMLEAKRIRDYNAMTAKGITQQLLELRRLELREKELDKWDGKLPSTLMGGNVPVIVNQK